MTGAAQELKELVSHFYETNAGRTIVFSLQITCWKMSSLIVNDRKCFLNLYMSWSNGNFYYDKFGNGMWYICTFIISAIYMYLVIQKPKKNISCKELLPNTYLAILFFDQNFSIEISRSVKMFKFCFKYKTYCYYD